MPNKKIVSSMMEGLDIKANPWPWYKKLYMRAKWKWFDLSYWWTRKRQTWMTGFAHRESFEFNHHHSKYVVKRLKHFRDNLQGIPSQMFPEDYDHSKEWEMEKEDRDRAHATADRRWYNTITKIIWAFEHWQDIKNPIYPDDYDHRYEMDE